jgi:dipeptidyl aminopeptidase/acylaminoacyl peptidase
MGIPSLNEIVYLLEGAQQPIDVASLNVDSGRMEKSDSLNGEAMNTYLGNVERREYEGANNKKYVGALLTPPDFDGRGNLPTVILFYPGINGDVVLDSYGMWVGHSLDLQVLATRGYAVFIPEVAQVGRGSLTTDVTRDVNLAADYLVKSGISDPNRMALMGGSFGAFCVSVVITKTPRFKAAIATQYVANPDLIDSYNAMSSDGNVFTGDFLAWDQFYLGGTIWQVRDNFIRNSPVFEFDKIVTPLLIETGALDNGDGGDDPLHPAMAAFSALRRLGKSAQLVVYPEEAHGITKGSDIIDFWQRQIEFLDTNLNVTRDAAGRMLASQSDLALH